MKPGTSRPRSYPRAAASLLAPAFLALALVTALGGAPGRADESAAATLRGAWEKLYRLEPGVGFDAAFSYRATTTYRGMVVNGKRESTEVAEGRVAYRGPRRSRLRSPGVVPDEARTLVAEVMARYETRLFDAEFDASRLVAESDGERTIVRCDDGGRIHFAGSEAGAVREWFAVKDGFLSAAQVRYPGPPVPAEVLFDFSLSDAGNGKWLLSRAVARWRTSQHFERDVTVTPSPVDGIPLPGSVELRESALNHDPDVKSALSKGGAVGREVSARLEFHDVTVVKALAAPDPASSRAGALLAATWGRLARVPDSGGTLEARVRADVAPGRPGGPTKVRVEGTIRAAFAPGSTGEPPIVSLDAAADRRCPADIAPHAIARAAALARTALAEAAPASYAREFAGVDLELRAEHPAVRIAASPYDAALVEMPSRDGGSIRFLTEAGGILREVAWRSEGETRLPARIVSATGVEILEWALAGGTWIPSRYRTVPVNDGFREDVRFEDVVFRSDG